MIKKLTGNKVKEEQMAKFKGGDPIFIIYENWCECYCGTHCGTGPGMTEAQRSGQYEYRE